MQNNNENKVEDILLKAGLISSEKLETIKGFAEETGEKIEKILLQEGITKYKDILKLKANKMGVEFIDLENATVDKNAVRAIKGEIAKKYMVFPFSIQDDLLFLAMENPDDMFLIDEVKVFTKTKIKPFLADSRLIKRAISYFYAGSDNSGHSKKTGVEDFIQGAVKDGLAVENITNISIDTEKRNIVITLNIKY